MKLNAKYMLIGFFVVMLCVSTFFAIKDKNDNTHTMNSNEMPYSDDDDVELGFDEVVSQSTHIIEAEYVETYTSEHSISLLFKPIKVLKGEVDQDNAIYVYPFSADPESVNYEQNETYMLFLEKNSSVYYEHDKYIQLSDLHVPSNDDEWEKYYDQVQTVLAEDGETTPSSYGVDYTNSTKMKDILQVSQNVFVVKIKDIYAKSSVNPTTVYNARVRKTIRNKPVNDGDILITFFNDTVEIGDEYVVLLADATDTAPVYTLSSRESVYSLTEAKTIPELNGLLQNAIEFETIINKKSDKDILKEEQEAESQR